MEITMEELGKNIFSKQPNIDSDFLMKTLEEFFYLKPNFNYYILLSKEVGYYTVFRRVDYFNKLSQAEKLATNFVSYLNDSSFVKIENGVPVSHSLNEVKMIEFNPEQQHLELWIAGTYFQFCEFDWGVEII